MCPGVYRVSLKVKENKMIPQEITNAIVELNQARNKVKDLILAEIDKLARNKYNLDSCIV